MNPKPNLTSKEFFRGGRIASASGLPRLSKRLSAVAALVPCGAQVADIGTDHGHLAVWLYLNGAAAVTASDLNPGPLESARRTAEEYHVSDKITFALSDGFSNLDTSSLDAAVIAGMGGETILNIISALNPDERRRISLILQPQSKIHELCDALTDLGYALTDADIVEDAGRVYITFSVKCSDTAANVEPLTLLASRGGKLIEKYIINQLSKFERERDGHNRSGRISEAEYCSKKIEYLKSILRF